ncbi:hypothetical protein [Pseudanabaena sp. 'Roaring Creek']|uniref:hypothetical protein n=1 Tax=Pseudanabaena sp. 'Roaring Creek' TaxID=1681830 RepID=UPI0006D7958B|nr:hypothetical protein [Pseudanabaena sp. 'Roaring Creek']
MATPQPEKRLRKKKKSPKKFRLSYSLLLLFAMIVVGTLAGLASYKFGKQALEGVNPSPAGIKLPKASPVSKPSDSTKSSPQSSSDAKTSFLLDEEEAIATVKAQIKQEIGDLRRPAYVAKANVSDRKRLYARVDRVYNSMRDPLMVSADADERIALRIAALRQKVYISSRAYESNFDRPLANNASSLSLVSTPVELSPIRSRWEDRDSRLLDSKYPKAVGGQILPQTAGQFSIPERRLPSQFELRP